MALLVGRHLNKIDKKGRVSVPKPFRSAFESPDFSGIYVFKSFKFPALEICARDFLKRLGESIDELALFSDDQDDLAPLILGNAHELAFDPEGRVVLPPDTVEFAQLTDQALFVGGGTRVQIWNPTAYESHHAQARERARNRGTTLQLRPRPPVPGENGE